MEVLEGLNSGAAPRGRGRARAGVHPRRRRVGQDDDDHAADRAPGRDGRVRAVRQILAVTFTEKAAGGDEVAARGARRRRASRRARSTRPRSRSFTTSPRRRSGGSCRRRRSSLRQIANGLPPPFKFRPAGDLATEIEWAKNAEDRRRRVPARARRARAADPGRPDGAGVREYERRKEARGEIDFEDLLELAIRLHEGDEQVRGDVPRRATARSPSTSTRTSTCCSRRCSSCGSATVTTCASSATTTSRSTASRARRPAGCSGSPQRSRTPQWCGSRATTARRPEVLELANRLVPRLGGRREGAAGDAQAGAGAGRAAASRAPDEEDAWLAGEVKRLAERGNALEEMAVLARTNARLADFEEAFHDAGIPFQGSSLLEREAARRMLKLLERDGSTGVAERVRALAVEAGMLYTLPDKLGERELTRQADLARLVRLAAELEDGVLTCAGFAAELRRRFDPGSREVRGVHLLTYHRAKGLEFDAVFLPRLDEKELPTRSSRRTAEERDEERRLFYVGITRARRYLAVTWSREPSPFIAELGVGSRRPRRASARRLGGRPGALRGARSLAEGTREEQTRCRRTSSSTTATLAAIAGAKPRSLQDPQARQRALARQRIERRRAGALQRGGRRAERLARPVEDQQDVYHSIPCWARIPSSIGCLTLTASVTRSASSIRNWARRRCPVITTCWKPGRSRERRNRLGRVDPALFDRVGELVEEQEVVALLRDGPLTSLPALARLVGRLVEIAADSRPAVAHLLPVDAAERRGGLRLADLPLARLDELEDPAAIPAGAPTSASASRRRRCFLPFP